ncbi:hypothetical protein C3F22_05330 [Acinetobacter sp. ACNIH1]|uniref:hypothetical protein n=1 Tax=Acinetobacter variabilis TaxID=70346 RepID=UPI000CDBE776|nr:hypothetical protein C3F22_05330 [Acinetobacter sp. ACNIH1]
MVLGLKYKQILPDDECLRDKEVNEKIYKKEISKGNKVTLSKLERNYVFNNRNKKDRVKLYLLKRI